MKICYEKSLCSFGAAIAAALVLNGCAVTEPKVDRFVPPPVGSNWTNAVRNAGSFGSGDVQLQVTLREQEWNGKQVFVASSASGAEVWTPDGGLVAFLGAGDKPIMQFDPALTYDWPLMTGKTWTVSYQLTNAAGQRIGPTERTCKVAAYEDVKVLAGTFKTFKIGCSTTSGLDEVLWFSPELGIFVKASKTRSASYRAGPGTQGQELVSFTAKR